MKGIANPVATIARCWMTRNRRPSKTSTAIFVATIARWWTNQNRRQPKTSTAVFDRGREAALGCGSPPSEPDWRISRIRLSSR